MATARSRNLVLNLTVNLGGASTPVDAEGGMRNALRKRRSGKGKKASGRSRSFLQKTVSDPVMRMNPQPYPG